MKIRKNLLSLSAFSLALLSCMTMVCNSEPICAETIGNNIEVAEVSETDSSEYFELYTEGDYEYIKPKKDGYYSAFIKTSGSEYFRCSSGYLQSEVYTSLDDVLTWVDKDNETAFYRANIMDMYLCYSEDGVTLKECFHISPVKDNASGDLTFTNSMSVQASIVSETSSTKTVDIDITLGTDKLKEVCIYKVSGSTSDRLTLVDNLDCGADTTKLSYTFKQNGTYKITVRGTANIAETTVTISGLKASINTNSSAADKTAPELSITFDTRPTVSEGESYAIAVKSNEVCNMQFNGEAVKDVTEYVFYVESNGKYELTATDNNSNTIKKLIEVTAFNEVSLDDLSNENLLNSENRDEFWGKVNNGDIGEYQFNNGNGSKRTVLPQAGRRINKLLIFGGAFTIVAGGVTTGVLLKKKKRSEIAE